MVGGAKQEVLGRRREWEHLMLEQELMRGELQKGREKEKRRAK